ncbi:Phosphoribosylaminoimidazole-succinocarboxamide synthase [Oligella urethralis]|uniref:phosphoribosylaminoimidazolesuccinocarboxamide synthase n=2 Tax=Oligella urethralis TaxID=90245 RepID=UPI000C9A7FD0|nr:phosphoribosylaminoimidazolesuccinocarboxamide synthase [Oligella urethralis]PMC16813.1 phosphoribosylaminoimidazolesuccinocarboxamide synthase [Oligella urethralis]WOS37188.1 Phosphoribosylaminoimidazole-succinocarboxamide synthase [Oligella urethralis]
MATAIYQSTIQSLPLVARGKVRDMYAVGEDHFLIVATDRISAFDVILDDPIPGKGQVLTEMTNFWLKKLAHIVPNHSSDLQLEDVLSGEELAQAQGRSVIVKRLQPILVEAVARGYIIGSGWKDYRSTGEICGVKLPRGLQLAEKLEQPIFTPAAKAEVGDHDINVDFNHVVAEVGQEMAEEIRDVTLKLYTTAAEYAETKGVVIADTKFEFGLDKAGRLHLMDEVLTPDSSRFWPANRIQKGVNPPSYDKQFVRDWLEQQDWDKTPPAPRLPQEVIDKTAAKYREALVILSGQSI